MKRYVVVTGIVFTLLTLAHVWRLVVEPSLMHDPWFMAFTALAAVFALAAWRVVTRPPAA